MIDPDSAYFDVLAGDAQDLPHWARKRFADILTEATRAVDAMPAPQTLDGVIGRCKQLAHVHIQLSEQLAALRKEVSASASLN